MTNDQSKKWPTMREFGEWLQKHNSAWMPSPIYDYLTPIHLSIIAEKDAEIQRLRKIIDETIGPLWA